MITDRFVEEYICTLNEDLPEYLFEIEKKALEDGVPIIKRPTQNLLRFLIRNSKVCSILEVGAAVGFSSLLMHEYMENEGKIITIEKMHSRAVEAVDNIERAGKNNYIKVIEGDALEELSKIEESFDMVFIDAAKGQYNNYFDDIIGKLSGRGILVCDNVLQEGEIARSRYAVTRRNRTIHGRMREFLYMITHDDRLDTIVLPIGDGVTISYIK
ncbi:MAG: O-methyltransferase [Lachnospiraceae bacterium]|nr:O-methyltransferase [Lachnospiraceae bacterium]